MKKKSLIYNKINLQGLSFFFFGGGLRGFHNLKMMASPTEESDDVPLGVTEITPFPIPSSFN